MLKVKCVLKVLVGESLNGVITHTARDITHRTTIVLFTTVAFFHNPSHTLFTTCALKPKFADLHV